MQGEQERRGIGCQRAPGGQGRLCLRILLLGSVLVSMLSACRNTEIPAPREEASRLGTVVLISLDGTRPADVTPETLPSLVALGERGLRAEGLMTVNPSNTFPSHVAMATGVAPEEHGIVNNRFTDPERGPLVRSKVHEWIESEPLWSVAERHGVPAASYYWVGSEGPWPGGPGPRETRKFSGRTTEKTKVNRILKWLSEPDPARRPRLIMSWFHGADHAAHLSGPGTPSVQASLAPQDAEIARLIEEMEAQGLFESTTLIFVADHGMVAAAERIQLSSRLGRARLGVSVTGIGGFAMITFDEGRKTPARMAKALEVARTAGLEAWPRAQAPRSWQVDHPRFGDIVVRAPIGTAIVTPWTKIAGFHGYDPRHSEMDGLLVAYGRGVVRGARLPRVPNLAIAPTVLKLLGIPVPAQMKAKPIEMMLEEIAKPGRPGGGGTKL